MYYQLRAIREICGVKCGRDRRTDPAAAVRGDVRRSDGRAVAARGLVRRSNLFRREVRLGNEDERSSSLPACGLGVEQQFR